MRFIKNNLLFEDAQPWQILEYGFDPKGKGDCLYMSAMAAMCYDDFNILTAIADCLLARRRWPEWMDHPMDGNYRKVRRMTRDPYWLFYCAAFLLDRKQFIEAIRPPWYLYRPHLWAWRKYLITEDLKYLRRYEFWQRVSLKFPQLLYALHLAAWGSYVADSAVIRGVLADKTGGLLFGLLVHKRILPERVYEYSPHIRFYWTDEEPERVPLYFGLFPIDKDILFYLMRLNAKETRS